MSLYPELVMQQPLQHDDLDWTGMRVPSCEPRVRKWLTHFQSNQKAVLPLVDADESGMIRALQNCEWSVVTRNEWLERGFIETLIDEMAISEVLWSVARVQHFVTSAELQEVIDRSSALAHLLGGIWELRFRLQDPQTLQGFDLNLPEHAHGALVRWLQGSALSDADRSWLGKAQIENELALSERLDTALCLMAIAQANDVLEPTLVAFDGVDSVMGRTTSARRQLVGELELVLETVARWLKYGSNLGIILMLSGGPSRLTALTSSSKRLQKSLNLLSTD